ncbi:MAG: protein-glutamate O-methyltransferase CheR [Firmicutes bacterium]|nr:protein-glutamate O-methyltransferase CheR [Bacillota bacterium]
MMNISSREYEQLAGFIKANYGINLGKKKQALVVGRLHNVLMQNNFGTFSEYYDYVTSDKTGSAVVTLIDRITTNHTFFMREADHFAYFRDQVLPYLAGTVKDRDLRIWSAGCSTGEEPYALAMVLDEYFGPNKNGWDTKILATDISGRVLDTAARGEYSDEEIRALPASWKINYFRKSGAEKSVVVDRIRNEVLFGKFNLAQEVFPFKHKFHVIFCRNVMIYFDGPTKDELTEKFYGLLAPGGYLFIGHSESLNREKTRFRYVRPAVFRKE